jgi:hypothetical protein
MTRQRLNIIIRVLLGLTLLGALTLSIVSARPGYRFLGAYPAFPATQSALLTMFDQPALFITLMHPAVVKMPEAWQMSDQICVVLRLVRGPARTQVEFNDYAPQIEWDNRPGQTVIFGPNHLVTRDPDGGRFVIANARIAPYITAQLRFRVNWLGGESTPIPDGTPVGGLLCYHFVAQTDGKSVETIPFYHTLSFTAGNLAVTRRPNYQFAFNVPDGDPGLQENTFRLSVVDIDTYLSRLALDTPFAVKPMTQGQADQRATEAAR